MTRDPTTETAIVSDIYYKWTNTNAFCWTLHNVATYWKNIKFVMLLVQSNIFWDNIKYTKHAKKNNFYFNNSYYGFKYNHVVPYNNKVCLLVI